MMDNRRTPGIKGNPKLEEATGVFKAPEGFWVRCPQCHAILQQSAVKARGSVCTECSHHFRMGSRDRISLVCDVGSFLEHDADLEAQDFLGFFDSKAYTDRLSASRKKARMKDAFVSGEAKIKGRPVQIGAFEFSFMGGSMGTVVGEKISRLFERSLDKRQPAILFQASGGARMQEGLSSLMQMAKTLAVLSKLNAAGVPYISILTDPTTGGVAASFALLGDVNIAEPNALVGFAGPRVIEQTINEKLPSDFQRAEFLLSHGMIDKIVHRADIKDYLSRVLGLLS
jgi:acetyl-CoA carboxylase carboxyl transferase subunit beta